MRQLPDYRLTISGEPESAGYQEQIRAMADRLPAGQVTLLDRFIDDREVTELFGRSSVAVLPYTEFAAQSGVLYDAIAHATPVIVSDVGGLGESVRQGGFGRVVAPNDPGALALAIQEMFTDSHYRAASEAIVRVRGELSWNVTAAKTLAVYRSVVCS